MEEILRRLTQNHLYNSKDFAVSLCSALSVVHHFITLCPSHSVFSCTPCSAGEQRVNREYRRKESKRVQENSECERTAEENRESSACLLTVAIRKLVMIKNSGQ